VVALGAFPVLINFVAGLEGIKQEEIRLMQSYNATKWQIFYHVRLFNSMPFLFAGLKLSMVLSVAGAVVAEFVTGHAGLAYLMLLSSSNLQIPLMFVCLLGLGVLGLALFMVVSMMEKVFMPWTKGKVQTITEATM
jgi:NitT/TauT family transport system permease protein